MFRAHVRRAFRSRRARARSVLIIRACISRSCGYLVSPSVEFAWGSALRRSSRGMPEVNSRNGAMPPVELTLGSPLASCTRDEITLSHNAATLEYASAFADMRAPLCPAAGRRGPRGTLRPGVASRDNSVNCRSAPGTGWPAIC